MPINRCDLPGIGCLLREVPPAIVTGSGPEGGVVVCVRGSAYTSRRSSGPLYEVAPSGAAVARAARLQSSQERETLTRVGAYWRTLLLAFFDGHLLSGPGLVASLNGFDDL